MSSVTLRDVEVRSPRSKWPVPGIWPPAMTHQHHVIIRHDVTGRLAASVTRR